MGFFSGKRIHRSVSEESVVDVSESKGIRSLHLGSSTIQSSMKLADPTELVLEYSRCMMGFLLFNPAPERVLMVGLGGGSIPKWLHRHLPATHTTVLEINPQVLAVARSLFFLPPNDEHLEVIVGDGVDFVAGRDNIADVILLDAFDGTDIAEGLNTESFYSHCHSALTDHGILGVNLWGSHPDFNTYVDRIARVFDGRVLQLAARTKGNIILLAFRQQPALLDWNKLRERARVLEAGLGLEFFEFVGQLGKMNPANDKRLLMQG